MGIKLKVLFLFSQIYSEVLIIDKVEINNTEIEILLS